MTSVAHLLTQIEGYADLITEAIEEKDWDRLNNYLVDRQKDLETLLAQEVSESERASMINLMVRMQASDQTMLVDVQSQKNELQKQLSNFVQDRKSVQAYQSD
ncbi:MAG: flagellar protein FliT [Methylococcales bacterium]|nr:flagellar protein FliT [Methylococcaceae bacterium]